MTHSITNIPIKNDLENLGVTTFRKEGNILQLVFRGEIIVIFEIHPGNVLKTIENFRAAAKGEKLDRITINKIIVILLDEQNDYLKYLVDDNMNDRNVTNKERIQGEKSSNNITSILEPKTPSITVDSAMNLDPYIQDRDYAEFVIKTTKKTVRQEDALVRQIFYTALSKDSADPINLAVLAPTAEGKTYAVLETIQYFPRDDVWNYGSMSPKVIIRQNGILVDSNSQPLEPRIKELKKEIKTADREDQYDQKVELEADLLQLYNDAKVMIDLRGKLLVFLEPPHKETWSILKPILSHDKSEIEHPYVYNVEGHGFKVKNIVTKGWPACIFCSAKNESDWPEWPEIQSRFLITSPNMIPQKYLEGNRLIAQRKGLPRLLQQSLIVSDKDVELAKICVLYLTQAMWKYTNSEVNPNPVWIPFGQILADVLHSERGTDNRITKRIFSFLNIVALSRRHLRSKLEYGNESLVIADIQEDLHEVLHITQNLSGTPTYKLKLFRETFLPLFNTKTGPDKSADGQEEEKIIAITSRQLCNYYKENSGKAMSTNNMKETYLNEFINNGLIDEEDSILDKRQKIYFPIVDSLYEDDKNDFKPKIKNLPISDRMDYILQHPKLLIPKNCRNIPENWLELEIFDLIKYPVRLDKFEIYDKNNERLCICKFVKSYQESVMLTGYFSKRIFCNYNSKIFGKIKYLDLMYTKYYEILSIEDKMDNIFISSSKTAVTNNILYSQTILANKISGLNGRKNEPV